MLNDSLFIIVMIDCNSIMQTYFWANYSFIDEYLVVLLLFF